MHLRLLPFIVILLAVSARGSIAEPVTAVALPAGTTAVCNDGSYSSSLEKRGACRGHRGIKKWLGPATRAAVEPDGTSTPARGVGSSGEPSPDRSAASNPAASDQVWVNENTKVYHCPGDKHYGKTEKGFYLSELDARRKGYHPNQNKDCSEARP